MFCGAPYDTHPNYVYVLAHNIILELNFFVVNSILFYNQLVCYIRMPRGVADFWEHHVASDRKCVFLY